MSGTGGWHSGEGSFSFGSNPPGSSNPSGSLDTSSVVHASSSLGSDPDAPIPPEQSMNEYDDDRAMDTRWLRRIPIWYQFELRNNKVTLTNPGFELGVERTDNSLSVRYYELRYPNGVKVFLSLANPQVRDNLTKRRVVLIVYRLMNQHPGNVDTATTKISGPQTLGTNSTAENYYATQKEMLSDPYAERHYEDGVSTGDVIVTQAQSQTP